MSPKCALAYGTALATLLATAHSAMAQTNSPAPVQVQIQQLQQQIQSLQQQLKDSSSAPFQAQLQQIQQQIQSLQQQVNDQAKAQAATAANVQAAAAAPAPSIWTNPVDGARFTLGGFIEAAGIYRSRNEAADVGSSFGGIPLAYNPEHNETELRGSARQSRLSLLAQGDIDSTQHLAAYFEADFLGAGTTSNFNESDSFAPRLRHAYLTYDNDALGWHFLAGQAWSLLTQDQMGIIPRDENIPLTIDASYVVGFNYTRNFQLRLVKDFDKWLWAGVSVESPQALLASTALPAGTGIANVSNAGGSFIGTGVSPTTDAAPDVIAKVAADPGWGHYEAFGIARFFTDRLTSTPHNAANTDNTIMGGGGGLSAILPVIPKRLNLQASFLLGNGIGRYGPAQFADVTVDPSGSLAPLSERQFLVGATGYPTDSLQVYAYAGLEEADANYFTAGGTAFGYGNPSAVNTGCFTEGATATQPATCTANNARVEELTIGAWQDLYKGKVGRFVFGAEAEYLKRVTFGAVGGAPNADDLVVMTSFRYYPF